MATKLQAEIFQLATSLDKAIGVSEESVMDILTALTKVEMTTGILKQTRVGVIVNKVKKTYSTQENNPTATLAQQIITEWKKVANASEETPKKELSLASPDEITASTNTSASSPGGDESPRAKQADREIQEQLDRLPKFRKQIADVLVDIFSKNCDTGLAKFIALTVEAGLNDMFSNDSKGYTAKFRTLVANLKRNEALRMDVISGSCTTDLLLQLSPAEMATVEQRDARAADSEDAKMARRGDFYAIKREEIQKSVGVTPSAGGGFVCRKCKKERTSFYQMQTRSSDEPMTVFINCLDCGFRWRE